MPKYMFNSEVKIDYCFDCPCCQDENALCKLDVEERRTETYRPMWCPLIEVKEPELPLAEYKSVMNCKIGDKVVYVYPENGTTRDQERAKEYLTVGNVYTLGCIAVHGWITYLVFEELPDIIFNSVMFEVKEGEVDV